jgi:beta-glucosidase
MEADPLFPFGYGLSYTRFDYSGLHIDKPEISDTDSLSVSVDVDNVGAFSGDEVVQLYARHSDRDKGFPNWRLIGIERIEIASGELGSVRFNLEPEAFREVDAAGNLSWIEGEIRVVASACAPVNFERRPDGLPELSETVLLK